MAESSMDHSPTGDFKTPAQPPMLVEKQQEALLKKKYGSLPAKSGSSMLRTRMAQRGGNKYFDSGDYNMARAKMTSSSTSADPKLMTSSNEVTGDHMPTPEELPRIRKGSQSNLVLHTHQS